MCVCVCVCVHCTWAGSGAGHQVLNSLTSLGVCVSVSVECASPDVVMKGAAQERGWHMKDSQANHSGKQLALHPQG